MQLHLQDYTTGKYVIDNSNPQSTRNVGKECYNVMWLNTAP